MSDKVIHSVRADPSSLSEQLAERLGRAIVAGRPAPGHGLPGELDLCARLGVSRPALREALRLLAAKGLIVTRRKLGTAVCPQVRWNMLDPAVLAWHLAATPTDAFINALFELRHMIEPAIAALAAERATAADLATLEQAFAEIVAQAQDTGDPIAADLRFHEGILAAAHNGFLASFGAAIGSALSVSFELSWDLAARATERSLAQHRAVLTAIRDRQAATARSAMTALLDSAIQDVRRSLAQRQHGALPQTPPEDGVLWPP